MLYIILYVIIASTSKLLSPSGIDFMTKLSMHRGEFI